MTIHPRINKAPHNCDGAACLIGTRVTVWRLMDERLRGLSDDSILDLHSDLTPEDLEAAWAYARDNQLEIERHLWEMEAGKMKHDGRNVKALFLRRGHQLGLSDAEIRSAFEPPLRQAALEAAWK